MLEKPIISRKEELIYVEENITFEEMTSVQAMWFYK